ncbi:hypothetical protein O181_003301 [Austropuccinia psidii MF-1]|uniref:Uncharacterized protein n=1 Tax=Austropuccinia psidii MF-1 TaxID=1389203 RepID=A0A9Q3GE15_9BASI|nr:hypothetical protein [Austropuccinia psidii MF-1]
MANITPDSQLSTYERLHQLLNGNQTKHEDNDSLQVSLNLTNENMEPSMEGCHIQNNYEDLPNQSSTQRQKRHTSEEAQLQHQKLEHECMPKQQ